MSLPRPLVRAPLAVLLALVTALALVLLLAPGDDGARLASSETQRKDDTTPVSAPIRLVHANIKSGMGTKKTKADVAAAFSQKPDFVTYNEVTYRPDAWLTPPGYALWRTPGAYTGETPVAWNTARWNLVDQGTFLISNKMRPAGSRKFELGLRYANWVSLQSNTGERMSVVSAHFAPRSGYTKELIEPSFKRLAVLVDQLRAFGPVMIGGDLNVNYKNAAEYPRTTVTALGLTPVYDVTGVALPTGMYRDSTIDYILLASAGQFVVRGQSVRTVNSDHRQLTAEVALSGASASAFSPGTVLSDPAGSPRAVSNLMVRSVQLAPKGAVVHLVSKRFTVRAMEKAVVQARKRGVKVQIITGSKKFTPVERRLVRLLGTNTKKKSWIARQTNFKKYGLPRSSSLVSASGGTRALRIDASRPLVREAHQRPTRAVVTIDKTSYDKLFVQFFKAVGRKV